MDKGNRADRFDRADLHIRVLDIEVHSVRMKKIARMHLSALGWKDDDVDHFLGGPQKDKERPRARLDEELDKDDEDQDEDDEDDEDQDQDQDDGDSDFHTYELIFRDQDGDQIPIEEAADFRDGKWRLLPFRTMSVGNSAEDGSHVAGSPGRYAAHNPEKRSSGDPNKGVLVMSRDGLYAVPKDQLVAWFGKDWTDLPAFGGDAGSGS